MPDDLPPEDDEIARLRGELAASRFCLVMVFNMLSLGDPRNRAAIRKQVCLASVSTDDDRIRDGFDRFKQSLLKAFPRDGP